MQRHFFSKEAIAEKTIGLGICNVQGNVRTSPSALFEGNPATPPDDVLLDAQPMVLSSIGREHEHEEERSIFCIFVFYVDAWHVKASGKLPSPKPQITKSII